MKQLRVEIWDINEGTLVDVREVESPTSKLAKIKLMDETLDFVMKSGFEATFKLTL